MSRKSWREAGCYVWRTRKPSAPFGFPLIGRHFAYVGETGSRYHRDPQHIVGGGTYGAVPKSWSDLDPKVYPLPCLFPNWAAARKAQETLWTFLLWPVYPVAKNRWNPRRISPDKAMRQRYERERMGRGSAWMRAAVRWSVGVALLAAGIVSFVQHSGS